VKRLFVECIGLAGELMHISRNGTGREEPGKFWRKVKGVIINQIISAASETVKPVFRDSLLK